MKTFRPGMDILTEVLTAANLNEFAGAARSVAELRDRLGAGGLLAAQSVRCHADAAIQYGQPVVPTAFASDLAAFLSPSGALSGHVSVRAATAGDADSALWGVALEDADAGAAFRAVFLGLAAVPVPVDGEGGWLTPDGVDALDFTDVPTRCRVLWVADLHESSIEGDGEPPFRVAMVELGGGSASFGGDPHLILRISRLSPTPLVPAGAWTMDGRAVERGTAVSPRIIAFAANLVLPEDAGEPSVETLCIGHRVRGVAADIGEGA